MCHYWAETGETELLGADPKDVNCLERKLILSKADRQKCWRDGDGEHEVTFAINLVTGELRLYKGPRAGADEWKKSFSYLKWLTGTIDWLHWGTDKTIAWVDDLKTGRWVTAPKESRQLRSYLLVPWVAAGMLTKWEGAVSVTHWPRYPLAAPPRRIRPARFTGLQMLEHLEDLRWSVEHPEETNPTEEWCRYCNSRRDCPAVWTEQGN